MSNDMVRRIIGQGGEKIREIQEVSGCKIDIAQEVIQKDQCSCSLIGTNENIEVAIELIQQTISMPMTFEVKMMIPNDMVGAIIGRGGMRIRRIQDESRCKIDFDKNVNQVQRTCSIIGTEENIAVAKRMIQKIVQNEEKRRDLPYLEYLDLEFYEPLRQYLNKVTKDTSLHKPEKGINALKASRRNGDYGNFEVSSNNISIIWEIF